VAFSFIGGGNQRKPPTNFKAHNVVITEILLKVALNTITLTLKNYLLSLNINISHLNTLPDNPVFINTTHISVLFLTEGRD
jgi:hypothetical protein